MRNVFLLSPANLTGLRAKQLISPRANFEAAQLYRSPEGVPIAVAFAFMSALYFRGKIAYANTFAGAGRHSRHRAGIRLRSAELGDHTRPDENSPAN